LLSQEGTSTVLLKDDRKNSDAFVQTVHSSDQYRFRKGRVTGVVQGIGSRQREYEFAKNASAGGKKCGYYDRIYSRVEVFGFRTVVRVRALFDCCRKEKKPGRIHDLFVLYGMRIHTVEHRRVSTYTV
jgi:hypothetical protein